MTAVVAATVAVVGAAAAWLATVPLYRFKELRPKTPRDVGNEAGLEIRATSRHARCAGCRHDMGAADVLPVIGWIRGCPACRRRLPVALVVFQLSVPVAAVVTAVVFGSDAVAAASDGSWSAAAWWNTAIYVWFGFVVASVSLVDARIWLIPWWSPWLGSAVGAVLMTAAAVSLGDAQPMVTAAVGAAAAFAFFFVLWFVAPGRLGFGDVRLAFMIGLFLGWLSPMLVVWGLLIGSFVGVVVGVWTMAVRRGGHFAFGPALSIGALAAVWVHDALLV